MLSGARCERILLNVLEAASECPFHGAPEGLAALRLRSARRLFGRRHAIHVENYGYEGIESALQFNQHSLIRHPDAHAELFP